MIVSSTFFDVVTSSALKNYTKLAFDSHQIDLETLAPHIYDSTETDGFTSERSLRFRQEYQLDCAFRDGREDLDRE